jgi:hypothetical protein
LVRVLAVNNYPITERFEELRKSLTENGAHGVQSHPECNPPDNPVRNRGIGDSVKFLR